MSYTRMSTEERRRIITKAVVQAARDVGLWEFNHRDVMLRCDVKTSISTVHTYFSTRASLRETAAAGDKELHKEYYGE